METRVAFRHELRELEDSALEGLDMVVTTLGRTMEALAQQNVELAELVVVEDDLIDGRYMEVHQGILSFLARQEPVATDLRLVTALLDTINRVERMGDQCVNIAKMISLTGPEPPTDRLLLDTLAEMGRQAASFVDQSERAFRDRNVALAEDLVVRDKTIKRLQRECFRIAIEVGDDFDRREWAMTMLLVARALERIADNAVDIGEQAAFVVTGVLRESPDASQPDGSPG